MTRLPRPTGPELIRALGKNGFKIVELVELL